MLKASKTLSLWYFCI